MNEIERELDSLEKRGLRRHLHPFRGLDFSSNDYLGLAKSNNIRKRLLTFLDSGCSLGSTGSRLISGESELTKEAENFLAKSFDVESALLFGSGYLANLGLLVALGGDETEFFSDELNHASLIDGIRLAKGRTSVFSHNALLHLEGLLSNSRAKRKVVVTESVFSMDGDSPDLVTLVDLCKQFGALLVLDEAHATGVCGAKGLGLLTDIPHDAASVIAIHTCGKALGAYGAFVTCSQEIRELLINKARSFIYSTALPPVLLAQIQFAMEEIIKGDVLRRKLDENIQVVRRSFENQDLSWRGSHISFIPIPGNDNILKVAAHLESRGIHVRAIRFPTVPAGQERLRITLKAFHTDDEISHLSNSLTEALQ